MKRFSLRSLALSSWGGYVLIALCFPLRNNLHVAPLPDVVSFHPSLVAGLLYVLLLLGLFLLYWLAYRRAQQAERPPSIGWILLVAAVFCLPLLLTFPFNATDVYRYFIRGRITAVYQLSPFAHPPSAFPADPFVALAGEWDTATSPYGPLWELVAAGVAGLSGDRLQMALILFKGLGAGLFLAAGGALWLILGRMGLAPAERTARTVLWTWNPALLLIFVADGHNDALMLFCLLAGTYLLWRGRGTRQLFWWSTAGLLVMGLASLSKPIGLLPLPFFFLYALRQLPNWRSRLGLTAVCSVMGVLISFLAFWPFANLEAEGASLLQLAQRLLSEAGASGSFSPAVWVIQISRHFAWGWRLAHAATLGNVVLAVGGLVLLWRGIRGRSPLRSAADIFAVYVLQALKFRIWYSAWPLAWLILDSSRSRITAGMLFLLNAQLSVVLYGHFRRLIVRNSLLDHSLGVPFVFGLPLLIAYLQWKRERNA